MTGQITKIIRNGSRAVRITGGPSAYRGDQTVFHAVSFINVGCKNGVDNHDIEGDTVDLRTFRSLTRAEKYAARFLGFTPSTITLHT